MTPLSSDILDNFMALKNDVIDLAPVGSQAVIDLFLISISGILIFLYLFLVYSFITWSFTETESALQNNSNSNSDSIQNIKICVIAGSIKNCTETTSLIKPDGVIQVIQEISFTDSLLMLSSTLPVNAKRKINKLNVIVPSVFSIISSLLIILAISLTLYNLYHSFQISTLQFCNNKRINTDFNFSF